MSGIGAYFLMRSICGSCHGERKCAKCDGTGTNTHLNETQPKCQDCSGSGVCRSCEGTGWFGRDSESESL
jgi:hypothetical protein